ncbi:hypothetical protein GIB67_017745, partial [Kingdonia uniflora]
GNERLPLIWLRKRKSCGGFASIKGTVIEITSHRSACFLVVLLRFSYWNGDRYSRSRVFGYSESKAHTGGLAGAVTAVWPGRGL